ncbi:MAG TPA: ABC transporter substrate-binding protein [Chloroflexota bacterium]|nr:ABC transporter substrate-binding protein [Chloroflexota bacterium]
MRVRALATIALITLLAACGGGGGSAPAPKASAPGSAAPTAQSAPPAPTAAGGAAQPSQPPALRKVRMALAFIGTEVLPVYVAQDQGLYRKYGLDVETTVMQSSAQVAPAMAAGDIDIALTAGAGVVDLDLAGGDQVIILNHSQYMHFMLQARPDIRRVEDLRDKRVAITRLGSGIHLATTVTLAKAGLEAGRDVLLVQAGGVDQVLGALVGGSVEAGMLALPFNFLAERQGFPQLVDVRDYQIPYMQGSLAVTKATLDAQYDLIRDVVRAHLEGLAKARSDLALSKRLVGQASQTDDDDLLERSVRIWISDLAPTPYPPLDAVQTVLDQRAPEIAAARTANPGDFVDNRILRDLEASGFLKTVGY